MEQVNFGTIKENSVIYYNGYLHIGDINLVGDNLGPVAYRVNLRCKRGSTFSRQYIAFNEMPDDGQYCKCASCFGRQM